MSWFLDLIRSNGNLSIFFGGLIEEIIIPIPSPLVSITAGALLVESRQLVPALGEIFMKISLPFSVGATIGSSLAYFLTYYGGQFLIEKLEKFLGFSWQVVEKTREKYIKGSGDELAIVLLRAVPVVPVSLISAVCGVVQYNKKSFYLFTFIGLLFRSFLLGIIGWQTGHAYEGWIEGLDKIETLISLVIIVVLGGILVLLYRQREKFFKT